MRKLLGRSLALVLVAASCVAPTARAGCPCGSNGYVPSRSTFVPPASLGVPTPAPTLAPLYAPPAVVHAPYGPEHIKYNYRYRPAFGSETYRADYPGRNDYMIRQTPTRFGGRVTERYGQ